MLQRYEKGGEKGASVRALAPDFFRHWSRFSSLPRFPAFAGFSVAALFSDFVRFPPPAPPPAPPPVLPLIPPLVPPFVLRSPWLVFSLRSILLPPVRHRLARCVRPCCPISSSAACCPAPSGPFLICSVPTCSAARPLFPLRYVPSRSLFRLRCVRPFLSACRRRPSGPPLSRARRRSSRVAAQTSAHSPVSPFYAFRHPSPPRCARSVRPRRPVTSFRPKNCPIVREKMQKITLPALSRFLIVIFFTFLKVFIPLCRRTPCCGPLPAGARGDDRARRRNALTTTGQRI